MPSKKQSQTKKTLGPVATILPTTSGLKDEKPNITISIETNSATKTSQTKISQEDNSNKRGRKPKGGKLISKTQESEENNQPISNVILHLKCSLADLTDYNNRMSRMVNNELIYNPDVPPEIHSYNSKALDFAKYDDVTDRQLPNDEIDIAYTENSLLTTTTKKNLNQNICKLCNTNIEDESLEESSNLNLKDINQKLKSLKINLYKNTLQDKKSACFWCTYDFDNQPCYIPKYEMDDKICGYGSFCRPECAVAFLMKENLDDSTKFERYHLLNHIYSKIYDYKKNIKPAPNPYYLLEKFFGNLSIQEYRKLLRTEHLLTVIDKPMSRTLPELFEDNDNFILGIYGNSAKSTTTSKNVYKVKRQSEKNASQTPSKNAIMKERFGLA
jgi:hypothetical protein